MNPEENDRKHLTPRQITNSYRKGEYVDENIEAISSAVSSCGQAFDCIAVAFPTTIVEKVMQNISTLQQLYERQVAGESIEDVFIEDYPQLQDFLLDLSYPPLWESLSIGRDDPTFLNILKQRSLVHKYHIEIHEATTTSIVGCITSLYRKEIKQTNLSSTLFELTINFMLR